MILWLRNLADMWADTRYIKANDALRRKLIAAEARIERQTQAMSHGEGALIAATAELDEATTTIKELREELARKNGQIERQADVFEGYRARIAELERTVVAMGAEAVKGVARGVLDEAWDDVAAVSGPEGRPQCPEGLLLDGVELHRCVRDGGHDGDHWSRGHERQWPQVEVDENCEVPW